jgi:hypothetical protein
MTKSQQQLDAVVHAPTKDAARVGATLGTAFHPLPVAKYLTYNPTVEELIAGFTESAENNIAGNAHVIESGDHQAVAIWVPPNVEIPVKEPVSERSLEFKNKCKQFVQKYVNSSNGYWYLNLLARHPESTVKGLVANVVKPVLKRAEQEGVPAVLEAASEYSKAIYEHWGFKYYDDIILGEGVVNEQGEDDPAGSGVKLYFMVYNNGE